MLLTLSSSLSPTAGCTIPELRAAGFPLHSGPWGGFTLRELRASPGSAPPTALLALIRQLLAHSGSGAGAESGVVREEKEKEEEVRQLCTALTYTGCISLSVSVSMSVSLVVSVSVSVSVTGFISGVCGISPLVRLVCTHSDDVSGLHV